MLILTAKADSSSLVVFRKFKRLISLVGAYGMVNIVPVTVCQVKLC